MRVDARTDNQFVAFHLDHGLDGDTQEVFRARFFGGLPALTPEELYYLIPTILPQERTCLRKAVAADFWPGQDECSGVYKLNNEEVLLSLPMWTWAHVCSFYIESDVFETILKAVDSEVVEG